MILLPFKVQMKHLIQLDRGKKPFPMGWDYKTPDYKPYIHPTAVVCEKFAPNKYLFVLDFDYEDKWNNPIYQNFKYKDTYTRETKHGLHLFYWSNKPCEIMQSKNNLNVDLRRLTSTGEQNHKRGNYIVLYDLGVRDFPVMRIDCNTVIEELYKTNNQPIRRYSDNIIYRSTGGNYNLKHAPIKDYHLAIAEYLKTLNSDWSHGYYLGFELGLKMGGLLKDELEAEAVATALMQITEYPYKQNWIINFVNGYNLSDKRESNIGDLYLQDGRLNLMIDELKTYYESVESPKVFIKELAESLHELDIEQYIKVLKGIGIE